MYGRLVTVSCCLCLSMLAACVTPPGDTEDPVFDTGTDEIDGGAESGYADETSVAETGEEHFKADGYCLLAPKEGDKGYRHHCGGDLDFTVEGSYFQLGIS